MRAFVVLNGFAGGRDASALEEPVRRAFGEAGVDAVVHAVVAPELRHAVREGLASSADAIVMGGGDGTLSAGANLIAGTGRPFGVLPFGTFNHFAKDLGLPLDLEGAVRTIAEGRLRAVDVGEANGRVFLNNASLGLYPEAVQEREERRLQTGSRRMGTMLKACAATFKRMPLVTVTVRLLGATLRLTTPLLFIGNNRYEMSLFARGGRSSLDEGSLSVYYALCRGRAGLLRLALRALGGRLEQAADFAAASTPEVEVTTRRPWLPIALDGELMRLPPRLVCRTRPGALSVLAPAVEAPA